MAFGSFDRQDDLPMADINVTPLVDVMLVLLIVFMITMPVLTHSIPLQLPTSKDASAPSETPINPLRLAINQNGEYYLDNQAVSLDDLQQKLTAAKQKNPDLVLAVAADKAVAYENVAKALEQAQAANVGKIGFETEAQE
ncbi:MAG: biopolymer transporter ExbD [Neisseria sp.]|nr:biopolymer transporter ExbD [Neisseria sp.]